MSYHYQDYVLEVLKAWRKAGRRAALLTLIETSGGSPRPLGSQMIVAEDGESLGMITGGCAEAALIVDAQVAIANGQNYAELYGEGSRFKDIVLPCGSGLWVYFDVNLSDAVLEALVRAWQARQVCAMRIDRETHQTGVAEDASGFVRPYRPQGRVVIVGQGPIVGYLREMVVMQEMQAVVFSPDEGEGALPLISAQAVPSDLFDAETALITVFHDHAYEPEVLKTALDSPAFYIAALGSRRAHAARCETLTAMGVSPEALARIHGPAGFDIGAKTPPEIALSILAQMVAAWRGRL